MSISGPQGESEHMMGEKTRLLFHIRANGGYMGLPSLTRPTTSEPRKV